MVATPALPPPPPSESLTQVFECFICFDVMVDPATLPCGHSACKAHLQQAFTTGFNACPLCQTKIPKAYTSSKLKVNFTLREAITLMFPPGHEEEEGQQQGEARQLKRQRLLKSGGGNVKRLEPDDETVSLDRSKLFTKVEVVEAMKEDLEARLCVEAVKDPRLEASSADLYKKPYSASKHRPFYMDSEYNFADFDLQRLLRRGGVLTESKTTFDELRRALKVFVGELLKGYLFRAFGLKPRSKLFKLVTSDDVISCASARGTTLLGFGGSCGVRKVWSGQI